MSLSPNYEAKSGDYLTPSMRAEANDAAAEQALYDDRINGACNAIRNIPGWMVTPAVITQLLATISCRATEVRLDEIADELDGVAADIDARSPS